MPSLLPVRALTLATLALSLAALGCRPDPAPAETGQTRAADSGKVGKSEEAGEAGASGNDSAGSAETGPGPTPSPSPKLVVLVVVDQMRADYLERFGPQFEHGFARLRDEGRVYSHATHQHAMTETAPGHATISTGTPPSVHGVISNNWYEASEAAKVNAVDDKDAKIFGHEDVIGVSPSRLLRTTVGDWMQDQDPASTIVSISLKDRAAILLGGKQPDAAIWYDDSFGGYTSSSYYGEARPSWVDAYNVLDRAASLYADKGWTLMYPAERYAGSRAKTDPAVITTFNDYALTKEFPHVINVEGKLPRNVIRDTPFGDRMTVELALVAIEKLQMGRDDAPDLLLLSMSAGDYTGHRYGPNSIETHDYYLRLDEALGALFTELDNVLGNDAYAVILTADHGVAPMPEYSTYPTAGRFVGKAELPPMLAAAAKAAGLGPDQVPEFVYSHSPHLLFADTVDEATRAKVRAELATIARAHPLLAEAYPREELLGSGQRTPYIRSWRRSFQPDRSPDVLFQLAEGVATYPEGTNHGTPYAYDQHVPLMLLGVGTPGVYAKPVHTVDIAPTIAALVGVEVPEGVDGKPLPLD